MPDIKANVVGINGKPVTSRRKPGPKPGYTHLDATKAKIRQTQLLNRAQRIALGEEDCTPSQARALMGLINKFMPDMKATELSGKEGAPPTIIIDTGIRRD